MNDDSTKVNTLSDDKEYIEDGLPKVAVEEKPKLSKKVVGISILAIVAIMGCAIGWFVFDLYQKNLAQEKLEAQEVVEQLLASEPALPEPVHTLDKASDSVLVEDREGYQAAQVKNFDLTQVTSSIKNLSTSLGSRVDNVGELVTKSHEDLKANLTILANNQQLLLDVIKDLKEQSGSSSTDRSVLEKLNKIQSSLNDIQSTKVQGDAFPIKVFSGGTWGKEPYVTVAPNDYPQQTFNLYVGQSAGNWTLKSVSAGAALFVNSDGRQKKVSL